MAWNSPRTWSTSEVVTATMMNEHVRDNLNYLKGLAGTVAIEAAMTVAGTVVATAGASSTDIISARSGNSANFAGFSVGRAASEARFAVPATAGQFAAGAASGDCVIRVDSSSQKLLLGAGATETAVVTSSGIGIGTTTPQGKIHGYGSYSGFIHWEGDNVGAIASVIVGNGTGDAQFGVTGFYITKNNTTSAITGGALGILSLTAVTNIASDAGHILQLQVLANGQFQLLRTGGTATWRVGLWLLWL